jgi:hypothetical protein
MECPRCRQISLDTETVCECGYNFVTAQGGRPGIGESVRKPAFWSRVAGWSLAFAFLGGFVGLFGGSWITCTFFYPGTHEADVCGYTGMATGVLGVLGGGVIGIAIAIRRTASTM